MGSTVRIFYLPNKRIKIMKKNIVISLLTIGIMFQIMSIDSVYSSEINKAWNDRMKLFKEMGANMRELKKAQDTVVMLESAKIININSKKLFETSLWPKGSGGGETRAKIEIWQNMQDFQEKFKSLEKASANLIVVVKKGDLDPAKESFRKMAKTCSSCHREYRAPKKW